MAAITRTVTPDRYLAVQSLRRLAWFAIGSLCLMTSSAVFAGSGDNLVQSVQAHASATIAQPVRIRTAELAANGMDMPRSADMVAPIAVSRRSCENAGEQPCTLVVYDMP